MTRECACGASTSIGLFHESFYRACVKMDCWSGPVCETEEGATAEWDRVMGAAEELRAMKEVVRPWYEEVNKTRYIDQVDRELLTAIAPFMDKP
jgi:hypothetical protein